MAKKRVQTSWFQPRSKGLGWGMPKTWSGWMVYAGFLLVWLLALAWLVLPLDVNAPSTTEYVVFGVIIFTDVLAMILILLWEGALRKKRADSLNDQADKSKP